jgi:endonuclease/exonuclease/phosphatase (EEP) superfamily protein YafD
VVGWSVVAVLAAITIVVVLQPGTSRLTIGLVALTPYWYLAAWPIVIVALLRRRWWLAVASLVVVGAQLTLVVPVWHPWVSARPAAGSWRLRLFDANVLFDNPDLVGIARQIQADHPDVVTLEELSTGNVASLEATGVMQRFGYHLVAPDSGTLGFGVWSDVPVTNLHSWPTTSHPEVQGVLHPATGPAITLLVVHTLAPIGTAGPQTWAREMAQIAARVSAAPGQVVVAGDLNATDEMRQLSRLRQHRLLDAAIERGRGWQPTWPANRRILPALIRPDHVLYTSGLTSTSYRLGDAAGSDHRPVLVTLARAASG